MLNLDMRPVLGKHVSRYSLVTAVARHARDLVDNADAEREPLKGKPVTLSMNDFITGRYAIVEPEEIRDI
ncbi:MAG: DNA-directed RNA polymerase subunit omega [Oscillospiraceae bacterium]|jgi:DNA-directed RNA polymerase subunit K/omega|nr:DNA-directed RNA polymerase subunit omega [Oscillospiraceae bacterium]